MGSYYSRACFFTIYGLGDILAQITEKHYQENSKEWKYNYFRTFKQGIFGGFIGRCFYPMQFDMPGIALYFNIPIFGIFTIYYFIYLYTYYFYWALVNNETKEHISEIFKDRSINHKALSAYLASLVILPIVGTVINSNAYVETVDRRVRVFLIFYSGMLSFFQYNQLHFKLEVKF
jgi:hypothetical protein